uniref:Transposable element P transposase-like GTP-binding insertion domain-containing protein n=1 Tax=Amphimedon queenslandica TaxID=400682 RepID=A0A1X7VJ84_AMPQE
MRLNDQRSMRWNPLMIRWCHDVRHYPSSGYDMLRESGVIRLPSQRTLRDYTYFAKATAWFSEEVDQQLMDAARLQSCTEREKCIAIVMDEMHLNQGVVYDKHSDPGLALIPKLKYEHIVLTSFLKMRVDLAAQVLSSSAAKGLEMLKKEEMSETKFVDIFDKWFDCLNVSCFSKGRLTRNPFKSPYRSDNDFRLKVDIVIVVFSNYVNYCIICMLFIYTCLYSVLLKVERNIPPMFGWMAN